MSPHRTQRPWTGLTEGGSSQPEPTYDPECYLCPGNIRAGGEQNPDYSSTFVFTNDYAALLPDGDQSGVFNTEEPLLVAEPEQGLCRVICYSPGHDLTIARMEPERVISIIDTWQDEYGSLGEHDFVNHVQIFENRGLIMGCSNPHPHGQVWANTTVPTIPAMEAAEQQRYHIDKGRCLLCDYLATELRNGERILFENKSFVALVPFWAVWPFETMILPRGHASSILSMGNQEKSDLASIMVQLSVCYDNLFNTSFPYSMGIHQQPTDGQEHPHWHYHIHYLPPLLRSSTVRKHMVGYELLAMPQRDITAESAAEMLRSLPAVHFMEEAG